MKVTTFAITTLLLAIGSMSDAKLVEVTRRKLEKRMAITSESGKPMKSDDYDLITELEALLEKHKSRMLEKPSSKDIEDKPGNQDLGGNSGKEPGDGNGKGQGQDNGVGYGVGYAGKSGARRRRRL